MHALADIALKTQFAAGCRNIQQLALDRRLEFVTCHLHIDQVGQPQGRTERIAALVVHHFAGQSAAVAAVVAAVINGQCRGAFPGNAHTIMETFNLERHTRFKKTLTVTGDHFVQSHAAALAIDIHHIALEALGAVLESNDQRVMALLQHPQVGGNFQRRGEHLWRLRSILGVEHV